MEREGLWRVGCIYFGNLGGFIISSLSEVVSITLLFPTLTASSLVVGHSARLQSPVELVTYLSSLGMSNPILFFHSVLTYVLRRDDEHAKGQPELFCSTT